MLELPFLAGIMSLALIIAIGTLLVSILPKNLRSGESAGEATARYLPGIIPEIKETADISDQSETLLNDIQKSEKDVFHQLKQIKKALPTLMQSQGGQAQLLQALREIHFEDNAIFDKFKRLKELNKAIQQEDVRIFEKLFGMMVKVPKSSLPQLTKDLEAVRQRLNVEKVILQLDRKIEPIMDKLSELIKQTAHAIQHQDIPLTEKSLDAAIRMEKALSSMLKPAEQLERKIKASFTQALKKYGIQSKK